MPALDKKKEVAIAAVVLALCAAAGYYFYSQEDELKLYGSIDMRTVELAFEESGRLESLSVEEGSSVKAGDVIGMLDQSRYRIARDQALSDVGVAKANLDLLLAGPRIEEIDVTKAKLKAAEAQLVLSDRTCRRERSLKNASSQLAKDQACYTAQVDRANRDEAKRTLEMLQAGTRAEEIEVARAELAASKTRLADAERALGNCRLVAPADGVVRTRMKEPGDMVSSNSPIFEIALMNPLWARVYIDEVHLGQIKMGQEVAVSVDSYPDRSFAATVGFISSVAEFTPKTVQTEAIRTNLVYEVRLTVRDPEGLLRLGMPVTARLAQKVQ
ncbi:MAG: efflux RND transporter periplasmic adaptor subunit [Candidatus Aphodousia sp.]|nr:efflux RND transporter periplasmic adaptor subunit [Sutterella sp.]MDY2899061.1 efflux RND transporter periplasmic adaptor subunit [Candidatus Aphodousia sp.]